MSRSDFNSFSASLPSYFSKVFLKWDFLDIYQTTFFVVCKLYISYDGDLFLENVQSRV